MSISFIETSAPPPFCQSFRLLHLLSGLAKLSSDEFVFIGLQSSLEIDAPDPHERDGKVVGILTGG